MRGLHTGCELSSKMLRARESPIPSLSSLPLKKCKNFPPFSSVRSVAWSPVPAEESFPFSLGYWRLGLAGRSMPGVHTGGNESGEHSPCADKYLLRVMHATASLTKPGFRESQSSSELRVHAE